MVHDVTSSRAGKRGGAPCPYLLRDVSEGDLEQLFQLATHLNTLNLPADRSILSMIIEQSERSFRREHESRSDDRFLFVLEEIESSDIVGSSMVVAAHGTLKDPHSYFQVGSDERFSSTLGAYFKHETLTFVQTYSAHTEIGALVLAPSHRGHAMRLGKALSFVRFLFIGMQRERFLDRVQAELLPPLEADGTSRLWQWLGRRFTKLSYTEADRLSRENKEFVRSLFPTVPIYTSLFPESVREVIGAVGPGAAGVEKMLRSVGFEPNGHIDPFDGGPHFEAKTDAVSVVAHRFDATLDEPVAAEDPRPALVGHVDADASPCFRAVATEYTSTGDGARCAIPATAMAAIGAERGDEVTVAPCDVSPFCRFASSHESDG